MAEEQELPEMRLDSGHLYREETFTDRHVGTIRKLVPVFADGSDDPSGSPVWEGSTSLMTPAGTLPLTFEIEAQTLSEALEGFPPAAKQALERAMEELRELRREQASSIVVPGQGAGTDAGGSRGGPSGGFSLR